MDHILPAGKVFQAGTLSGNPLATAAGIATLRVLRETNPLSAAGSNSRADWPPDWTTPPRAAGVPHALARVG